MLSIMVGCGISISGSSSSTSENLRALEEYSVSEHLVLTATLLRDVVKNMVTKLGSREQLGWY